MFPHSHPCTQGHCTVYRYVGRISTLYYLLQAQAPCCMYGTLFSFLLQTGHNRTSCVHAQHSLLQAFHRIEWKPNGSHVHTPSSALMWFLWSRQCTLCTETYIRCGVVCTGSGGGLVNGGIEWGFDAPSHSSAVYERPLAILAYWAAHRTMYHVVSMSILAILAYKVHLEMY